MGTVERVKITDKAADVVAHLRVQHGALLFHQSGGCCDGSSPMCYPSGDFRVGPQDVLLGEIAECKFYIGAAQFEYWRHTQLIIDVVPGRGSGFSVEARGRAVFDAKPRFHRCGNGRTRSGRTACKGSVAATSRVIADRKTTTPTAPDIPSMQGWSDAVCVSTLSSLRICVAWRPI
jgi:uncharacterized protein